MLLDQLNPMLMKELALSTDEPTLELAELILHIVRRVIARPGFIATLDKDKLTEIATNACLQHYKAFDPEKSQNPFAYFVVLTKSAIIRQLFYSKMQMGEDLKKELHERAIQKRTVAE